jgi:hypothetical protein
VSDPTGTVLDAEQAAFIQSGVSILVASRDAANVPRHARALGCRVGDDRRKVTVFLAAFQAAGLLAAIRSERVIAVAFNLPSTHRALQLKGGDAVAVPAEPADLACAARYADALVADIGSFGWSEAFGRTLLWFEPAELTAVTFTPTAAFDQTPGPRAGTRLGS